MKREKRERKRMAGFHLFYRLVFVFLALIFCMESFAQAKSMTMKLKNATVEDVFNAIKRESGYTIAFNNKDVNLKKQVSIDASNQPVEVILDQALTGQDLEYTVTENHIVLSKKGATNTPQGRKVKVTGKITDDKGEVLIGASISEKGTNNGTITDMDGNFTLNTDASSILAVSYVGFDPKEILLEGRTSLNIILSEDSQLLDEVVVTALGIKRDRKALGYSMQELKSDGMTETRDPNVANALSGKVAGLQIKQSGTGPAGSSRIVLRGNNSIGANNQPLIIVDGIPIDNTTGGSDDFWGNKSIDRGSGLADVSPDDIETISVLKGPAAAALYGSRAGNGVIMITTKKGSKKGLGISLNSNLTFENPMETPQFQNVYGQGTQGKFDDNQPNSWGAKMEGQPVADYTTSAINENFPNATRSYTPGDNDLYNDFLQTGTTWTNSLDMSAVGDNSTFRVSLMNMDNKGVIPNSGMDKTSFTLRSTGKWGKLSADAKITFVTQKTENRVKLAADPDNIFNNYLMMPRSVHFSDLGNTSLFPDYAFPLGSTLGGVSVAGSPASWTSSYNGNIRNPYWAAYKNVNEDRKNRYFGFFSLKYDFTDYLNLQVRSGLDMANARYMMTQATGTPYWEAGGDYSVIQNSYYESNSDVLINFNKNFLDDRLGVVASVGGNMMHYHSDELQGNAGGTVVPNFYKLINGKDQTAVDLTVTSQTNSIYGTASFSYDSFVYLDLTGRNDWVSTLNPDNRSFFYPSVGGSWVITEMLSRMDIGTGPLSYGKLRASWAEVGNAVAPYQLVDYVDMQIKKVYNPNTGTIDPIVIGQMSPVKALWDLKAEKIQSWEVGAELKAFNNRLGLDVTYYNKDAKNQILKVGQSGSSGDQAYYANAGCVNNKGFEIILSGKLIDSRDLKWDLAVNFSKNTTKIVSLTEKTKEQILGNSNASFIRVVAREGGGYGELYGTTYIRDDKGNVVVDDEGLPLIDSDFSYLGNYNPDWMAGFANNFSYKGLNFSFLIDMRYGGEVYMGSIMRGMTSGTLEATLDGRESMVVDGVTQSGAVNTVQTTAQNYYNKLGQITEPWIYDATNVRLREVSLGYSLPKNLLSRTPLANVKLSLVARNLWMIYSKTDGFDPEAGYTTSNAQGIEYGSMPTMRSVGFNLNVTF